MEKSHTTRSPLVLVPHPPPLSLPLRRTNMIRTGGYHDMACCSPLSSASVNETCPVRARMALSTRRRGNDALETRRKTDHDVGGRGYRNQRRVGKPGPRRRRRTCMCAVERWNERTAVYIDHIVMSFGPRLKVMNKHIGVISRLCVWRWM
jgi:hypothetical protein